MFNTTKSEESQDTGKSLTMPELDKRQLVLAFLAEHDIPLGPIGIYGGLVHTQDITFSYSTVQNIMRELAEQGAVERVQIDPSAGEVRPLPDDGDRRAYYLITDQGRERLAE